MKISVIIASALMLILSGLAFANPAVPSGDAEKGKEIAAGICAGCHNSDGNSIIPNNPILAGQYAEYTAKQLRDFRAGNKKSARRDNPIMASMVANLSDEDMENIAAYYAHQQPQAGSNNTNDQSVLELGEKIYLSGNLENAVPACSSCHSVTGHGIPPHYPRLGGQHATYTFSQLQAYRHGTRANDINNSMQTVVSRMTVKEMKAVSEFISTLK